MNIDLANKNINEFIKQFELPQHFKKFYSYGLLQKKIMKLSFQYFLEGGDPMQGDASGPKLGNLTNDDVGMLAIWKQDPHGINVDSVVQKAVQEFGQNVQELSRGIGQAQYGKILKRIEAGKEVFNLSRTQSFTRDYETAAEFAKHGGGSIHDTSHGSGGVVTLVNTKRKPMFFLDEFHFYEYLIDMNFREIAGMTTKYMPEFIEDIDLDDVFKCSIFEDEWLVPTTYKFNFVEAVDGDCENKDLLFEVL